MLVGECLYVGGRLSSVSMWEGQRFYVDGIMFLSWWENVSMLVGEYFYVGMIILLC